MQKPMSMERVIIPCSSVPCTPANKQYIQKHSGAKKYRPRRSYRLVTNYAFDVFFHDITVDVNHT